MGQPVLNWNGAGNFPIGSLHTLRWDFPISTTPMDLYRLYFSNLRFVLFFIVLLKKLDLLPNVCGSTQHRKNSSYGLQFFLVKSYTLQGWIKVKKLVHHNIYSCITRNSISYNPKWKETITQQKCKYLRERTRRCDGASRTHGSYTFCVWTLAEPLGYCFRHALTASPQWPGSRLRSSPRGPPFTHSGPHQPPAFLPLPLHYALLYPLLCSSVPRLPLIFLILPQSKRWESVFVTSFKYRHKCKTICFAYQTYC